MRLSASTNFFGRKLDGTMTPTIESMRRCRAAGFKVLNIGFSSSIRGGSELVEDNWEQLIYELRDEAEKLDMEFSQSHPPFTTLESLREDDEFYDIFKEMMERSIIASSILGVRWAVLHPVEEREKAEYDLDINIRTNLELYGDTIELAKKHNVGIAFENMIERVYWKRRFAGQVDELIALIDAFNDSIVGACWDFGHANIIYRDQRNALRTLGKRLKATHVADNNGVEDDHMFPFRGTVDWHSIMPVLGEIEYEGDFTFETGGEFSKLPEHLKDKTARLCYEVGEYCLSLVND